MARSGESRAQANRRIRQEALLEQLEANGHYSYSLELIKKIENLNTADENFEREFKKLKEAKDSHVEYAKRYLPQQKLVEIDGSLDLNLEMPSVISLVAKQLDGS